MLVEACDSRVFCDRGQWSKRFPRALCAVPPCEGRWRADWIIRHSLHRLAMRETATDM